MDLRPERTAEASKDLYPSISSIISLLCLITEQLCAPQMDENTNEFAETVANSLSRRFPNNFKNSNLHASAMVLDPCYKNFLISNVELQQVKDFVLSLSNDKPSEETDSVAEVATTSSDVWSFFEQAKRSRPEPTQQGENCDDEWGLYLRDPPIDRKKSPLTWWGENAKLFPNLAPEARMLLAIPATVVPSERHWSDAGNNHQSERINESRNFA